MAESQQSRGGLIGAAVYAVAAVATVAQMAWHAVTKDGYLAAAFRQGLGELAEATKPFPESIQVHEPGTLWNPTQGEIAADRREFTQGYVQATGQRSPSEIAADARGVHSNDHDHGGVQPGRSPGQIAADARGVHGPDQQQGHEHEHGQEHEHGL